MRHKNRPSAFEGHGLVARENLKGFIQATAAAGQKHTSSHLLSCPYDRAMKFEKMEKISCAGFS
jgi:hypothetical protein